jgi:hypothetical protein
MKLTRIFFLFALALCFARAEVYEPKPGTPERKGIMDAMRGPISKHVGKEVQFTGTVKVSGAWARFEGDVAPKDGKPPKGEEARAELELDFLALLRKEEGEWKVLFWAFTGDISAYEEAKKKYPQVPKDLMPDLPQ